MNAQPTDPASHRPAYRCPALIGCCLLGCALLVGTDLALKHWAFTGLPDQPVDVHAARSDPALIPDVHKTLIPGVLALKLTVNRGAVFGLGQGRRTLLVAVTLAAVVIISLLFARSQVRQHLLHLVLVLILAGALGNLYDRLVYQGVRDMLWLFPEVHLPFGWHWPRAMGGTSDLYPWLFNLADVYLVSGIALMLIRSLFHPAAPAPSGQPAES